MTPGDTIAAISSAVGPAARMIVRLSGPQTLAIADAFLNPAPTSPGASSPRLRLRGLSVPINVYFFVSPRSYTGEDLLEFHLPGNPLLCRMLLDDLIAAGARSAELPAH